MKRDIYKINLILIILIMALSLGLKSVNAQYMNYGSYGSAGFGLYGSTFNPFMRGTVDGNIYIGSNIYGGLYSGGLYGVGLYWEKAQSLIYSGKDHRITVLALLPF